MRRDVRMISARSAARGGYLYVAVLAVALLVSMIGLSAMHVARTQLRTAQTGTDWLAARLAAQSGVERAATLFNTDPNWQTTYALSTEYPVNVASGSISWRLMDLGKGRRRLDGIGRIGKAMCVHSVGLARLGNNPLAAAVVVDGTVTVSNRTGTQITVSGAPLATNDAVQNSGTITGNVEAAQLSGNYPASGTAAVPGPIYALPDPNTVFEYYTARGATLDNSLIPNGGNFLAQIVLSPNTNPYGSTNGEGIYVIDCQGKQLTIENCRIVGTLVVLNTKQVVIQKQVNWEPALPNYPALMVQGALQLSYTDQPLDESLLLVNFNPLGSPYQGAADILGDDTYTSAMAGIVYCTGDLAYDGMSNNDSPQLQGVLIVGGNCTIDKTARPTITYDAAYLNAPPPGFGPVPPGTLRRRTWQPMASF